MRIFKSHPFLKLVNSYIIDSPQPSNISYAWNFGSLLLVCLVIQIATGVTLAMHYSPSVAEAFNSIEHFLTHINNIILLLHIVSSYVCFSIYILIVNRFSLAKNIFNINPLNNTLAEIVARSPLVYVGSSTFTSRLSGEISLALSLENAQSLSFAAPYSDSLSKDIKSFDFLSESIKSFDTLSEEEFNEWFRGLVDAEGSFMINPSSKSNQISFSFHIYLHKDDTNMLNYIAHRLKVGHVRVGNRFTSYVVSSQSDLVKIIKIFDKIPLNTSKNLNFLMFKKGYELYYNRTTFHVSAKVNSEIIELKTQMNKQRVNFQQPSDHRIVITPYWLLGLVEGEGYFSVSSNKLVFGVGLTAGELVVIEAISKFLLSLPGKYKITRKDTNVVGISVDKKAKDENSKPMARLYSSKIDYLTNVLIPFFDSLTWFSKKKLDYEDWKLILQIKNQGKHFTEEGKDVINLIAKRMNNNRLSTNLKSSHDSLDCNLGARALNLISGPSNYEMQADGKIFIKSLGKYLKGRGNINVLALDEKGEQIFNFGSIQDCASFFNVHSRTINRRLDKGTRFEYDGKNLILKREISPI